MITRRANSWQLILADLALILFLITLSALAADGADGDDLTPSPQVAAAQALYRPDPFGPSLNEWVAERPYDPRATLTIFAQHRAADKAAVWERAQAMASGAEREGFAVRVVITQGETNDLYASLAYDAPVANR